MKTYWRIACNGVNCEWAVGWTLSPIVMMQDYLVHYAREHPYILGKAATIQTKQAGDA